VVDVRPSARCLRLLPHLLQRHEEPRRLGPPPALHRWCPPPHTRNKARRACCCALEFLGLCVATPAAGSTGGRVRPREGGALVAAGCCGLQRMPCVNRRDALAGKSTRCVRIHLNLLGGTDMPLDSRTTWAHKSRHVTSRHITSRHVTLTLSASTSSVASPSSLMNTSACSERVSGGTGGCQRTTRHERTSPSKGRGCGSTRSWMKPCALGCSSSTASFSSTM
jgi:hypothetical protein